MPESMETVPPEVPSIKRSVFRPEVLQREIERRDLPVTLAEVPRRSAIGAAVWGCAFMAAICGLLYVPITVRAGTLGQVLPAAVGSPQIFVLQLTTAHPELITPGNQLRLAPPSDFSPLLLQVEQVTVSNAKPRTGEADSRFVVAVRARASAPASLTALSSGMLLSVTVRTRFLSCLASLRDRS